MTTMEPAWQMITTAPQETDVLVYDGYRMRVASLHFTCDDCALAWVADGVIVDPTHWMPLPTQPSE